MSLLLRPESSGCAKRLFHILLYERREPRTPFSWSVGQHDIQSNRDKLRRGPGDCDKQRQLYSYTRGAEPRDREPVKYLQFAHGKFCMLATKLTLSINKSFLVNINIRMICWTIYADSQSG